ncbi:hypothetical protein ACNKHV_25625 [Shigella flexneri]
MGVEAQRLFEERKRHAGQRGNADPRGVVGLLPANRVGDDIEILP